MADESQPDGDGDARAQGPIATIRNAWANPAYRFVMLFLPYLGAAALLYPLIAKKYNGIVQAFILSTANIEYWLFSVFSDQVAVNGKLVTFGGFAVKIVDECTGLYEMVIFSAAVLAFPTSWRNRALGILLGNPLIYLFNVARIGLLIWVGRYAPKAFDFMHLYFMQATMIVMITSVWLLWIVKVVRRDHEEAAPLAAA